MRSEDTPIAPILGADRREGLEHLVPVVDPVSILTWGHDFPVDVSNVPGVHDREFLLPIEVVANVAVMQRAAADGPGPLHEQQNGDSIAAAGVEDLPALASALFASGALVPAEVVDVDVVGCGMPT